MTRTLPALALGLAMLLALPGGAALPAARRGDGGTPSAPARICRSLRPPPLFVENRGQTDARAALYLSGRDLDIFLTEEGIVYSLRGDGRSWAVRAEFPGAARVRPEGADPAPTRVSLFRGARRDWKTGLATFREAVYHDLWPGIDLRLSARPGAVKSTWVVHPGADPSRIRIRYAGAGTVTLGPDGSLAVGTPAGGFTETGLVALEGAREIPASFVLSGDAVGFTLGERDPSRTLLIDPTVYLYGGFIGGGGADEGNAVAVDAYGSAHVVGSTVGAVPAFPAAVGPFTAPAGQYDAFIARLLPDGSAFLYCGFIGGAREDRGYDVAVDEDGTAYVAGRTRSDESTFPVTVGPDLTFNGVSIGPDAYDADAFVAAVDPSGTSLAFCGYVGGAGEDSAVGIAVDADGLVALAGTTASNNLSFPVAGGPDLSQNGSSDAFVAVVAAGGAALLHCGYIGGTGAEYGQDVAFGSGGSVIVGGQTASTEDTFPAAGGFDTTHNGGNDAFLARVQPGGVGLSWCTYVGGADSDIGRAVAVDVAGSVFLVGETRSDESTFPVEGGPDPTYNLPYSGSGGTPDFGSDAFIAKVSANGATLEFAGYLGGGVRDDFALGLALAPDGTAAITGGTRNRNSAVADTFVQRVDAGGTAVPFSVLLGGQTSAAWDQGNDVAVGPYGDLFVAGTTDTTGAAVPRRVGPDLDANGGTDAFVFSVADPVTGLALSAGSLKDSPRAGSDSVKVKASVDLPPPLALLATPDDEDLRISVGGFANPYVLTIPARDPGWKVAAGKYSWKGAGGKVTIDMGKRTATLALSKIQFPSAQSNPLHLELRLGGVLLRSQDFWTQNPRQPGTFRFP